MTRTLAVGVGVVLTATLSAQPGGAVRQGAGTVHAGAPAAVAQYSPPASATTVEGGLYSSVVSDGAVYHSVMRTNAGSQTIQYRRSSDGGRTWVTGASWAGESGGATRPAIAVSGRTLAITFIGGYCQAGTILCGEAVYLVRSADRGRTFTAPVRLSGGDAFDATVGVDGERIWVAWSGRNRDNDSTVFVRRYSAMGSNSENAGNWPGVGPVRVAAAGGGGVVTFLYEDPLQAGKRVPRVQLLRGDSFGAPVDLSDTDPKRPLQWTPIGAAAAGGRVHLLFQDGAQAVVRSAKVDATDLGPVVVAIPGTGASIAARHGLVAVAAVDGATGLTSVARSQDGSAFSEPTAVAQTTDRALSALIGLAVQPEESPSAVVTWSVAPRYTDRDGDSLPDPANSGSAPPLAVALPDDTLEVTLDASRSTPGVGATKITECTWRIDDTDQSSTSCQLTARFPAGQPTPVSLTVTDDQGYQATRNIEVSPKDLLVVSLGDSVASGEGNPHIEASLLNGLGSDVWEDGPCHRSHFAGPALAARQLEERDPHTSVTFVQLACSGAAMLDVPKVPGQPGVGDDPGTGGVLDKYQGVEPDGTGARPSQLAQMSALIGPRKPDSVLLSIGANDVVFSDVLKACLVGACTTDGTKATLDARLAELPGRYAALGAALDRANVPDRAVTISQYYDVSSNDEYLADLKCVANATNTALLTGPLNLVTVGIGGSLIGAVLGDGIVTDDEAIWARDYLGQRINDEVRAGAQAQGWATVGGFEQAFARHGYCASDPWIVSVPVSVGTQHDEYGSFHPNRGGHGEYGRRLGNALLRALVQPRPLGPDEAQVATEPGDAYVITQTEGSGELALAAVRDEGTRMAPIGVRRLDRPAAAGASGPFVGTVGPPAADGVSAAVTWYQLDDPVGSRWRSLLAQGWLVENASVDDVGITQAAFGATKLVAGREAVAFAGITLSAAEPRDVEVTTIIRDDLLKEVEVTTTRRLTPGQNVAVAPFTPELGRTYAAQVTVTDPPSASRANTADNSGQTSLDDSPTVVRSRPLRILAMPLVTDEGAVGCVIPRVVGDYTGRNLRARVPVSNYEGQTACSTLGTFDTTRRGAAQAVSMLDYFARLLAVDSVVGVAQNQWLYRAEKPGVLAIANVGGRGIVFNEDSQLRVVTHEATHNLGFDHWQRSAAGWDVAASASRGGQDYMNPFDGDHWVAAGMWDAVATKLGGPENTPKLPDPASPGFWVRGELVPKDGGGFGIAPGRWVPAGAGETTDPRLGAAPGTPAPAGATAAATSATEPTSGLDLSRMTARQVAADGSTLAAQPVPLEPVGGVFQPGTTHDDKPIGYTFSGLINPVDGATTVHLVLDGEEVETRPINQRPLVNAVTAPSAGATANRGEPLTVSWDATDPDGDTLTADLLVSGDDGASWHPLGYNVGTSPASVTVPVDLDGDQVKVRVVVSDGVRMAVGDSSAFTVGGTKTEVRDRIVFSRDFGYVNNNYVFRVTTMDADGGNEVEAPLPTASTWDAGVVPTDSDCKVTDPAACGVAYFYPSWSDDGSRLYFSSNLVRAGYGGAATGQRDYVPFHLWSSKPDGTDLTRITEPVRSVPSTTGYRGSNWCPNVSSDRMAWVGDGNGMPDAIWSATLEGADQRPLFKERSGLVDTRDRVNYPWPEFVGSGWLAYDSPGSPYLSIGFSDSNYTVLSEDGVTGSACPRFSPDGTSLAFVANVTQKDGVGTGSAAVIVMDVDGSNQRIVSNALEQITGVDWLDNHRLLLTLYTPYPIGSTWDKQRYTAITLDLDTQQRTEGRSWLISDGPVSLRALGRTAFGPTADFDPTHSNRNYDLATVEDVENATNAPVKVVKAGDDRMFDGIRTTVTTGGGVPVFTPPPPIPTPAVDAGGPYTTTVDTAVTLSASGTALADPLATAAWDLDGDGAFDDAVGRSTEFAPAREGTLEVKVRVAPASASAATSKATTLTVLARPKDNVEVDPDAVGAPGGRPALVPLRVTIPAGATTPVRLGPDGASGPFSVLRRDDVLVVASGSGASLSTPPTTGTDGTVLVTPEAAFRGSATLTYARLDEPDVREQVVVEVTGNSPPTTGDDSLIADAGVRSDVDPATLLANDADPDAAPGGPGLRIVSVTGMTSGEAWLTADGDRVIVVPGITDPAASFTYTVLDAQGGLATATVRVRVRGTETPPPPPDPSTPPPPDPSTSPPPTATPPPPTATPPPATPPPTATRPPATPPPTATPPPGEGLMRPGMVGALSAKVYFGYKSTTLTKGQKRKLRVLVAKVPVQVSLSSSVVGVARAKGATRADLRRALKRARVVRDYLEFRGVPGRIVVTNDARTRSKAPNARRVNVTIRYVAIP